MLNPIFANSPLKVVKKDYSQSFKQARSLEKNALFDEAKIIYKEILSEDPGNKIAFNKVKIILKNNNDLKLLQTIAEDYQKKHPNIITANFNNYINHAKQITLHKPLKITED